MRPPEASRRGFCRISLKTAPRGLPERVIETLVLRVVSVRRAPEKFMVLMSMTVTPPPESSNRPLEQLSDQALLNEFGELVRQDHDHVASLLRHIDVIDRRKLWARQGYSSLFEFLVSRHHMSESTAGKRIGAARTARRFPILFAMVARGEIHLSGIHRLKTHLTRENHEQVLALAKHRSAPAQTGRSK